MNPKLLIWEGHALLPDSVMNAIIKSRDCPETLNQLFSFYFFASALAITASISFNCAEERGSG